MGRILAPEGCLLEHLPEGGARSGVPRRTAGNRSPREVRHPALRALRPGCEELARTDPDASPVREKRGARPKIATVERREASVPRHGTQGASQAPDVPRHGTSNGCRSTRTFLGAPPTPRFGVSEATSQTPGAENAPRERDGLFDIVRRSASAVATIVPSPLAGEGSSVLPRAMMGEGDLLERATPHPFESLGTPLCPLPQRGEGTRGARQRAARFGQTKPRGGAGRSTNLRL